VFESARRAMGEDAPPVREEVRIGHPSSEIIALAEDEHPDLMDLYLTNGSRSIPIAVIMDAEFRPLGRWGPRPAALQELVMRERRAGERLAAEIYRDARRWYARDRGETTLREVLAIMAEAV